ncbi:MAG: outer membrane beta-barrel protein, partial [Deltaproteobacteria bacterium]|nr:outer membrane beta-barrel protein [Deltaproteobacteria bacterium]
MRYSTFLAVFLAFMVAIVSQAYGGDGSFYLEGKVGLSNQKVKRDVTINAPQRNVEGTLELGTGAIPIGSFSNSSFAGGLAFGFDMNPRFAVPVRFDLEYLGRTYKNVVNHIEVRHAVRNLTELTNVPEEIFVHESSNIGVHTFMANAYYDLNTNTAFTPFVGASFGLAVLHLKIKSISIEDYYTEHTNMQAADVQLAWGLNAGVSYALNN